MYDYLTMEQFLEAGFTLSEHVKDSELEEGRKLADKISEFYPAEIVFLCHDQDKKKVFAGHVNVHLCHPTLQIEVSYSSRYKKYKFWCRDLSQLENLTHYSLNDVKKELTEPQGVGVLTQHKVIAWVNYFERYYKAAKAQNEENGNKIQAFRDSLKGLPVKWYDDKQKSGTITKNGIEYSFTIEEAHVSQNIKLLYSVTNDLATFLKLSDNKYIQPVAKPYSY